MIGGVTGGAALLLAGLPWQCAVVSWMSPEPTAPPPSAPPRSAPPPRSSDTPRPEREIDRVVPAKRPRPQRTVMFPDAVVVRTLDTMRPSLVRCFARARQLDPTLGKLKVLVHLDVDPTGTVIAVTTDTELPKLATCLSVIARQMRFPAPGQPAVVDVPLMF